MTESEWLNCCDFRQLAGELFQTFAIAGGFNNQRKTRLLWCGFCNYFSQQCFFVAASRAASDFLVLAENHADDINLSEDLTRTYARVHRVMSDLPSNKILRFLGFISYFPPGRGNFGTFSNLQFLWENFTARLPTFNTEDDMIQEQQVLCRLLREIAGNPFRLATLDLEWRTSTVISLAKSMYESRDFSTMPILSDALQDAGCENEDILNHCRGANTHVRGCWVVDLLLGKE